MLNFGRLGISLCLCAVTCISPCQGALAASGGPDAAVMTDEAIRNWLSTHPEVLRKAISDALKNQVFRGEFDQIVHDSLMRQPNTMAELSAAVQAKQESVREARFKEGVVTSHQSLYHDAMDGRVGSANSAITVIEFVDAECPYCKALQPNLTKLVTEHPEVSVIYKEFPILGAASEFAAKVGLAAVNQGKYSAFHEAIMALKIPEHQLTEADIIDVATSVALDVDRVRADIASKEIVDKVAANRTLATSLGISGTPGLIVGDQLVPGAVPYERLVQMLEPVKAATNTTVAVPAR